MTFLDVPIATEIAGQVADTRACLMDMDAPITDREFCEEMDPDACRALWCEVIYDQWQLVFGKRWSVNKNERAFALNWFGTPGFADAANLAGFDPAWLYAVFLHRLDQVEGGL
ncbi:hypothetical protein GN241_11125 [Rhodobacteraceae bacterium IMCC1335]